MENQLPPILSESTLLILVYAISIITIMAGIAFTVLLYKDPGKIRSFRGGRVLHYVTVLAVVIATLILSLERILTGEAAASILGGIIGYVLGTLNKTPDNNTLTKEEASQV